MKQGMQLGHNSTLITNTNIDILYSLSRVFFDELMTQCFTPTILTQRLALILLFIKKCAKSNLD